MRVWLTNSSSNPESEEDMYDDEDGTECDEDDDVGGSSQFHSEVGGNLWNDGVPYTHQHQHCHRHHYVHVLRTHARTHTCVFTQVHTRTVIDIVMYKSCTAFKPSTDFNQLSNHNSFLSFISRERVVTAYIREEGITPRPAGDRQSRVAKKGGHFE